MILLFFYDNFIQYVQNILLYNIYILFLLNLYKLFMKDVYNGFYKIII